MKPTAIAPQNIVISRGPVSAEKAIVSAQVGGEASVARADPYFGDAGIAGGSGAGALEKASGRSLSQRLFDTVRSLVGSGVRAADKATAEQQGAMAVDDLKRTNQEMKGGLVGAKAQQGQLAREIETAEAEMETEKRLAGAAKGRAAAFRNAGDEPAAAREDASALSHARSAVSAKGRTDRLKAELAELSADVGRFTTAVQVHEAEADRIAAEVADATRDAQIGRAMDRAAGAVDGLDRTVGVANEAISNLRGVADHGEAHLDVALSTGRGARLVEGEKLKDADAAALLKDL